MGATLNAESQAATQGAEEKAEAMKKNDNVAHNLRATTEKRISDMISFAWAKKKAEMGFVEINCEQPHQTNEQKLKQKVDELQSEKLMASKLPPSPHMMDPVAAKEIENRVKSEMQQVLDEKLNSAKKEMAEKLAAQKRKEAKVIAAAEAEAANKVARANKQVVKAEAAAQSAREASRTQDDAKVPKLKEGWGMVHERI